MADKIFIKGLEPCKHNSAPDFVLLDGIVITPNELFTWLKVRAHSTLPVQRTKQLKLQVTKIQMAV